MLEIFIPTHIKQRIFINDFSLDLKKILKKNFNIKKIEEVNSKTFSWVFFELEKFDLDLIILLNWEFWKFYFLDYDIIKHKNIKTFWTSILKIEQIEKNLGKIETDITEILEVLNSNNLLTNTKKEDILIKINKIFFSLSGIWFILYKNKLELEKNSKTLENYKWLVEYEAQAKLLKQLSKTKKIEISANLEKFENMLEIYLEALEKVFI